MENQANSPVNSPAIRTCAPIDRVGGCQDSRSQPKNLVIFELSFVFFAIWTYQTATQFDIPGQIGCH